MYDNTIYYIGLHYVQLKYKESHRKSTEIWVVVPTGGEENNVIGLYEHMGPSIT